MSTTQPDHASRQHATWSASATARNWACPGALAMAARLNKPDTETIHSARGTACHEIAEKALNTGFDADKYLGTTIKTKSHEIEIDEELANSAQEFIDYVRERHNPDAGWTKIEQNFSLASLKPPFDAGGTADAVIYDKSARHLEVVDLKNGMGVVEVEANKQLRTYALGALLANPGLDVERVTVTIVQPRAPHKDGRIRSETFHVVDLMEWTAELLEAMQRSKAALDNLGTVASFAIWWSAWLKAGNHCRFCPAEGQCPKQEQVALDAAGVWFNDQDQAVISNQPETMDGAELAKKLDTLDMIEGWIGAVRRVAHEQAEAGVEIPNYQLVEKIGNRKWGSDDETVFKDLFLKADLTAEEAFTRKLKSPAQIEKVLGAKRKNLIDNMWRRDVTGKNLVRVDKTSRPAAKPAVHQFFTAEGQD